MTAIALFQVFAFVLGAIVGSFLNVVIYRLPIGLKVNEPKRSFCPHCKTQIPFGQNIPLISWLLLRAKCAKCGEKIPFRYFGVELLTGVLFLLVWNLCSAQNAVLHALPLWVLMGLLISATFIDFDHFIIPDEITLGGTAAGVVFSLLVPSLHGQTTFWQGLLWSVAGAAIGYGLLWGVVEAGKIAFGRKKLAFDPPQPFTWTRKGEDADFAVGDESMLWSDIFSRESDLLIMETEAPHLDGTPVTAPAAQVSKKSFTQLRFHYNKLMLPGAEGEPLSLDTVGTITGKVSSIVIPREAMGFGDVKFIACIGAFLGWKAVLFTILAASLIGSVIGVGKMLLRRDGSRAIPFGPYLALGALIWIFAGPAIVSWYFSILMPEF